MTETSNVRYVGELKSQLREGYGVYNYDNKFFRYEGEWLGGKKHGHGKLIMKDGSYYEGEFKGGEIQGNGTKWWSSSGNQYNGQFEKGELCGFGIMYYGDGSQYEGEWVDNIREGSGVMIEPDGSKYTGGFHKHKRHGEGRQVNSDGSEYEGDWVAGMRQGHGVMKFSDESMYAGQWRADRFHGQGAYLHSSGCSFEGIWRMGKPELEATHLVVSSAPTVEILPDETITFEVCCCTSDEEVPQEHGRLLQVTAGIRLLSKTGKNSLKHSDNIRGEMRGEESDGKAMSPFQTPFGFNAIPYPLLESQSNVLNQEEPMDFTSNKGILPGDVNGTITDTVKGVTDEINDKPYFETEVPIALGQKDVGVSETEGDFGSKRDAVQQNSVPLGQDEKGTASEQEGTFSWPSVSPIRVVGGKAVFEGLWLPFFPEPQSLTSVASEKQSTKDQESKESQNTRIKKADATSPSHPAAKVKGTADKKGIDQALTADAEKGNEKTKDSKDKKKRDKKEDKPEKEERKYCRPGDYVLVIKDITNPPFLDTCLEPAFLHVRVLSKAGRSGRLKADGK